MLRTVMNDPSGLGRPPLRIAYKCSTCFNWWYVSERSQLVCLILILTDTNHHQCVYIIGPIGQTDGGGPVKYLRYMGRYASPIRAGGKTNVVRHSVISRGVVCSV